MQIGEEISVLDKNIRANPEYIKLYKKANVKVAANLIEEKIGSL